VTLYDNEPFYFNEIGCPVCLNEWAVGIVHSQFQMNEQLELFSVNEQLQPTCNEKEQLQADIEIGANCLPLHYINKMFLTFK